MTTYEEMQKECKNVLRRARRELNKIYTIGEIREWKTKYSDIFSNLYVDVNHLNIINNSIEKLWEWKYERQELIEKIIRLNRE